MCEGFSKSLKNTESAIHFLAEMSCAEVLTSELDAPFAALAHSSRDTSRAEFEPSNSLQQKRTPKGVLFAGAESEIHSRWE